MTNYPKPSWIKNNPMYSLIWTDVFEKDLDALIAVCGRRGHCKSGSALRFGEDFDVNTNFEPRFTIDHVFFKASDFVDAMRQKYPKGTVLIWDEVGVENDSRSWYSMKNKMIKYVMETNRYRNFVVLITVPTLKSVDISTQRLMSGYIEMHGKVGDGNQAIGKFEFVETNPKSGKAYFKRPRFYDPTHRFVCDGIIWNRPSKELEEAYQKKKEEYTMNLWKNINSEMEFMSKTLGMKAEESKTEAKTFKELEQEVIDNLDDYYDRETKRFNPGAVAANLGIGLQKAAVLIQSLTFKIKKGAITV